MPEITPELLSAIGSLTSAVVALFALYQIKVSKDAIRANAESQRAFEAARQCERFIEVFIPAFREVDRCLEEKNFNPSHRSFGCYLAGEKRLDVDIEQLKKLMDKKDSLRIKITDAINHLEILSVSFIKAIASSDVGWARRASRAAAIP